jgi:hypothetical protein
LLGELLDSLGVKVNDNEDSDDDDEQVDSRSVQREDTVRCGALRYVANAFKSADIFSQYFNILLNDDTAKDNPSDIQPSVAASSSSSSNKGSKGKLERSRSSSSEDSGNDRSDDDNSSEDMGDEVDRHRSTEERSVSVPFNPRVGPSMPSTAQLAAAQDAAKRYIALGGLEEEGDDDFGPAPQKVSVHSAGNMVKAVPLGFTGTGATEETLEEADREVGNKSKKEWQEGDPIIREEWMTNPGEDRAIAGFETFGVSRKFQTGKKAKKTATATTEQREAYEESMKYSEEAQKTQAILAEYKEKRGASLMERHVDEKAKKQPTKVEGGRRAFDRELVSLIYSYIYIYMYIYIYIDAVFNQIFGLVKYFIANLF